MVTVRRLYRDPGHRVVAGVASGIATHLGLPTLAVRIAFIALLPINGLGALLYAAFWAVLPAAPGPLGDRPAGRDRRLVLPFLALGVGIVLVSQLSGFFGGANGLLGWLIAMIAVGAGLIWHLAEPGRRRQWREAVPQAPWLGVMVEEGDRRSYLVRLIGGGLLIVTGIFGTLYVFRVFSSSGLGSILDGLIFTVIALAGVALVVAPLLWRTFSQLRAEREGRIREQERAELAAMVHDQVLHTLALIQRNSGDGKTVLRLARGQERSLRNWLYKPAAAPCEVMSAALEEAVAEVEDTYAIAVESVVVGDYAVDDRVGALVAAAREAMVNAGKHAKVQTISLYAEVEQESIAVFVRDRGVGFDPSTVEDDRHGVRGSIVGRMERHGGRAEIRSQPGEGTEVRLFMPISDRKDRDGHSKG
ncbi:ATP-binding protein [Rugosimonospora acidiphila]|uniref:ATP-binding protein n=1 Tax=Rugosimonospora acidiphila TaxID=556531 RepID=A0ABP9RJ83_9ACTN